MRMGLKRMSIAFGLVLAWGVAAQTVYESTGGQGKVYSDRPLPGGKPVDLQPLNVIEAPPAQTAVRPRSDAQEAVKAAPPAPTYRKLSVVFPEASGSVAANYATFEVRVSIEPPLRIDMGHALVFRMDGRNVPGRYTATEIMFPPEFFGDVAPAGVQQHVLQAFVVDGEGRMIVAATPVSFQTRFVNVLQRPHPLSQKPLPLPLPRPLPQTKPGEPLPYPRPANEALRRQ
ncbi:MAG: DUF4124 domain-containing protein [Burkholderiaceae bacterium]|nr:DUF4124 domain-containing protein [Burkholderiaceae bacterium]